MTVSITADLDASVEDVWAIISDFAHLGRWHPDVVDVTTEGTGVGATRRIAFADWWVVERLDRLDNENHVLGYSVIDASRPPVIGVSGSMSLSAVDATHARLYWESGQQAGHPMADQINAGLEAYYPTRVGHLRAALQSVS
ncbi:hypothetical protein A0J57_04005 [Sphingobium sp. 22B]|uniref:SRPBCC family protein n=1 Tax=unclassified Sphingobium TaxID=2611147 RepID=UPI0007837E3F|nr:MULTISPECIES: SRPBCC family protein [unclassified Sphingobium]KXU33813.1 hypothetical protein AXW74_00555 [Sphingobium sp. AM]KYC33758.1 hypothetical protein A0J57_04005 [Sphingobium sp. 22B]OAP33496.1 hypothetical protein A8O16_03225 [Sphingobium sp. 20006FA]